MARPGVHQSLLLQVFFLAGRLDLACASCPVGYPTPSPSCIGIEFPHVDENFSLGKYDATQFLATVDRYTQALCQHIGSPLRGVSYALRPLLRPER